MTEQPDTPPGNEGTRPEAPESPWEGAGRRGSFRAFLETGQPGLLDGAMGTMLYGKGVFLNRPFEELNLTAPEAVREVHAAYLEAGADILETNTFTANRFRLSAHGLAERVQELNAAGVAVAREVAGDRAWVAGSMGPLGVRIEPLGPIGAGEAAEVFSEQAQALGEAGVDLFVLETFAHLPELEIAIAAVRAVSPLPIVAQMSVEPGGVTREGVRAEAVAEHLEAAGADVIGVNCADALAALQAVAGLRRGTARPLSVLPNAGAPRSVEGRKIYLGTPEYFAAFGRRALRNGVRLLGGCCGTTPEHIRVLRAALDAHAAAPARPRQPGPRRPAITRAAAATRPTSQLAGALAGGRFVTGVVVPPVQGWDTSQLRETAQRLVQQGVGFLGLSEGAPGGGYLPPVAQTRVAHDAGIEPLITYTCRGRRVGRIQSAMLGAYAAGAVNILAVTGQPMAPGAEPDPWPDLEVDSIGLINLLARLNRGEDLSGNHLGPPTDFLIAAHADPTAPDQGRELSRLRWKVEAGAQLIVTSPLFEPAAVDRLQAALKRLSGAVPPPKVVATLRPLTSAREAELLGEHPDTAPVPPALVERMEAAEARGEEEAEGRAIANELAAALRPRVAGLQVVAPGGRVEVALAVLASLR